MPKMERARTNETKAFQIPLSAKELLGAIRRQNCGVYNFVFKMQTPGTYLILCLLLFDPALSHFTLDYPLSLGYSNTNEGTSPCGGYTPSISKTSQEFHVGGHAIALTTKHNQSTFLFRATLDGTAKSGWANLLPLLNQSGLDAFCMGKVEAQAEWAAKKGIIQVIQSTEDGLFYQVRLALELGLGSGADGE